MSSASGFRVVGLAACLWLVGLCNAKDIKAPFLERFDEGWNSRWVYASDPKYTGKFSVESLPDVENDTGLKVTSEAKHYGIVSKLPKAVNPSDGLALQFEVKFTKGLTCGGAYIKFLTETDQFNPSSLKDATPYTVMFGPDKCGSTNKVHLIVRHKNPLTGIFEEKHLVAPPSVPLDENTHVYTAVLMPDNTFSLLIDGIEKKSGSLFEEFDPPFVPPKNIPDPKDKKPADWVDDVKIPDPEAVKPVDWDEEAPEEIPDEEAVKPSNWLDDEPKEIDDPSASKPDDWDDEEDGEWEPPKITNPKCLTVAGCGEWERPMMLNPAYKGKWTPPLIDNPLYKGPWKPRDIANPDFYDDPRPLSNIGKVGAVAVEVWTMDKDYFFDNILVGNTEEEASLARKNLWQTKHDIEVLVAKKKAAEERNLTEKPVFQYIEDFIDSIPWLASHKSAFEPALHYFKGQPSALYAMGAILFLMVFAILLRIATRFLYRRKNKDPAAQAKKADIAEPDDAPDANGTVQPAARTGAGTSAAEITEQPDEDEDEDDKTGGQVRRRARRDT